MGPMKFGGGGAGDLVITKTELALTILAKKTAAAQEIELTTNSATLPWLKTLAHSFERSRFLRLHVKYVPGCAMTQAGRFTMGMDWDWSDAASTRQKISGYQPNAGSAVWQPCQMQVPVTRGPPKWYYAEATDKVNRGPGKIICMAEAAGVTADTTVGEVWVTYTVILSGPRS